MNRFFVLAAIGLAATGAVAAAAPRLADTPQRAADPGNKVVCKTFTRIGSLADRYRTCKTAAEWQRERDNLRDLDKAYSCRQSDDAAVPCK
ncbi:MAG: hypothetical protein QOJ91_1451 [Sphingomonadales bacterium]|jgi:hypothetical protein|nr:hypothetical protein [Sphingomonadales bacterium]